MRQINEAGLKLIKDFEECRLEAFKPTPTDPWTIGWGHTDGVKEGDTCTQAAADDLLLQDLDDAERIVVCYVTQQLTDNQFAALVSFVYNVGPGVPGRKDGFVHLIGGGPSSLLRYLNRGEYDLAADEFPKWDRAGGRELPGLKRRRLAEQALFNTEDDDA